MAKDFAVNFYKSAAWVNCRDSYIKSVGGLCERCYKHGTIRHGEIVHHKIHLTPENINNPEVTLNYNNLELLCRYCHAAAHKGPQKRYIVDEEGKVYTL